MLRALPLLLWAAQAVGGISQHTSAPRALLARRISSFDHVAAKESSRLIPGIVESMPEAIQKVYTAAGLDPPPMTKIHSGHYHVCQPWEKCDGQEDTYEEEVINASIVHKAGTQNISKGGALVLPPRKCPEWGATQLGCECLDSCECAELSGSQYAPVRRCATRKVKSQSDGTESPCGTQEFPGAKVWYDTCLVHTTPFPRPVLRTDDPKGEAPENKTLWRNFNAYKAKRFLPKSGCYSRDQYCADFPMFDGCDPEKTYKPLHGLHTHLSEEQEAVQKKCKAIKDQKKCEEAEECGKGKHKTCHHSCVWTEDAPMWFRTLRGDANMKIKKSKQDPATVGNGEMLPVLQPGPGSLGGEFGVHSLSKTAHDSDKDTVIKKSDKMEKAGSHMTTPPPEQVLAGDVGTKRSEGWLDPPEVGKNIGSDNQAVGKFRPRRDGDDFLL